MTNNHNYRLTPDAQADLIEIRYIEGCEIS